MSRNSKCEQAARRRLGDHRVDILPDLVELMCEGMVDDIDAAYVSGAVADPTCKNHHIGRARDDLDIIVIPEGWNFPMITTGAAYLAKPELLQQRITGISASIQYAFGTPYWKNDHWECSVEEAWEKLPEPARNALEKSTEYTIHYVGPEQWPAIGTIDLHFAKRDFFEDVNDPNRRFQIYPER